MKVRYSTRSKFFPTFEDALHDVYENLRNTVEVQLPPGGYAREAVIEIRSSDDDFFEARWKGDPSRFSARIRALAVVLRKHRLFGDFNVSHRDGHLTISPA